MHKRYFSHFNLFFLFLNRNSLHASKIRLVRISISKWPFLCKGNCAICNCHWIGISIHYTFMKICSFLIVFFCTSPIIFLFQFVDILILRGDFWHFYGKQNKKCVDPTKLHHIYISLWIQKPSLVSYSNHFNSCNWLACNKSLNSVPWISNIHFYVPSLSHDLYNICKIYGMTPKKK